VQSAMATRQDAFLGFDGVAQVLVVRCATGPYSLRYDGVGLAPGEPCLVGVIVAGLIGLA
jgi:hypothetical protein